MDVKIGGYVGQRGQGKTVLAKSHAALTKGYMYYLTMDSAGYLTFAIPSGQVGVPVVALENVASGEVGEFMVEGVCECYLDASVAVVLGHGVIADNSLTHAKDANGAFSGNPGDQALTHCGVVIKVGSGAGYADNVVYLHGLPSLSVA